jgi:hypothetical protein
MAIMSRPRVASALLAALLLAPLAASQAPAPVKLTEKDLQALRWIEGSWRGTGGGVPPFFERYRFDGPATLLVEHLDGEKVTSTSRYALQNGEFASVGDKVRSVATAFDQTSITFHSADPARGSYRWQRENANAWKAILKWPASGNRAAGERVYALERLPAK